MNFNSFDVPLVKGLSHSAIEKAAQHFLSVVCPESLLRPQAVPVLDIFENKMQLFDFRVLIGKNVKGLGGFTDVTHRYIQLSQSTYRRLEKGDPQAKFTVAHEFGHACLHAAYTSAVFTQRSKLRAFEDPEWQANAFSAALLMPLASLRVLSREKPLAPEELMETYKVSWSAAKKRALRLEQMTKSWPCEDARFSF